MADAAGFGGAVGTFGVLGTAGAVGEAGGVGAVGAFGAAGVVDATDETGVTLSDSQPVKAKPAKPAKTMTNEICVKDFEARINTFFVDFTMQETCCHQRRDRKKERMDFYRQRDPDSISTFNLQRFRDERKS